MNRRVMIVENDPDYRGLLASVLEHLDYSVVPVSSAKEATDRFSPGRFDCLVVNSNLPSVSGIEFVKSVRCSDPKVGVVMLTSSDIASVESDCEGLSVWAVCKKPVNMVCLADKIESASELANLSPDVEERIAGQLAEESNRTRHLASFLLNETDTYPVL
jgi:DNA-binding response OmpR family regulator